MTPIIAVMTFVGVSFPTGVWLVAILCDTAIVITGMITGYAPHIRL